MHSFILLKSGYPIFAFDPDRKYEYFNYLEMGRESDISDFVRFIVEEHKSILSSLHKALSHNPVIYIFCIRAYPIPIV